MGGRRLLQPQWRLTGLTCLVAFYAFVWIVFALLSPTFRSALTAENLLRNSSHIAILAVGQTVVIILGGIDLSVGSTVAVVGMVMANILLVWELPGEVAILGGLATGIAAGLLNGLLITVLRIEPFVATLATLAGYRGVTYMISNRRRHPETATKAITDETFLGIEGSVGPIPYTFLLLVVFCAVVTWVLFRTSLGQNIYFAGGNPEGARLAGVNTNRLVLFAYGLSGLSAAAAALVLVARFTTSSEDLGNAYELSAIGATIIGGVSLQGGRGNCMGPAVGAFLIGTIFIGLSLAGVSAFWLPVVSGAIIVGAAGFDPIIRRFVAGSRDTETEEVVDGG